MRSMGRQSRTWRLRSLLPAALLSLATTLGLGLLTPVGAAAPWWQPVAFPGRMVSSVAVRGGRVLAVVDGRVMVQTAAGFMAAPSSLSPPTPQPSVTVRRGGHSVSWSIAPDGALHVSRDGGPAGPSPGSPDLGRGAHLLAVPLAVPRGAPLGSVVVAVSQGGVVWRRAPDGAWAVSLVLLPRTLVTGTPAVTSITAFSASTQSGVVYLGTAGYGTLLSPDGGDDWIRADPGLPSDVTSLAANPSGLGSIWAATGSGLYVHRLQPIPEIPSYSGGGLTAKWLLTIAIALAATLAAAGALRLWFRRPAQPEAV